MYTTPPPPPRTDDEPITRGELRDALQRVETAARAQEYLTYDSIKSMRLLAKAEVCEELIEALGL